MTPAVKGSNYGAQWWLNNDERKDLLPEDTFFAFGFEHQIISIIPSQNLIVLRFGICKGSGFTDEWHVKDRITFVSDIYNAIKNTK